ncbi:1,4-alpha-glucan branching enzyme GlgB (modular protein) [Candidatus Contendobacter odensis Run_B_J11]|uniref:1,4-alpha-glucan branching enzyme GlgB n=1 Tax=Candidatus Contendobacter odensis Run_B_J11 TaxID=1400861 RepID=A0A7U7J469_9GAMM|nr:1,4-alpha-glucan branching protein GlgB [Candidatus Contendobacter odensis]CDH46926.1 1,4-alpha-glucan branching enzyme GlgB (modular protein) [Candidatus Contendobacter odensis Run_B_J11]
MLEEQIRKIVELRHDAPYAILGPHASEREPALTIRAFLPQAKRAYVLPDDGSGQREMQKLHPDGLFVTRLPGIATLEYRLIAVDANGQTTTFHDPYAIHEPSFTRADGQAFQQGALENLFTRMGAHPQVKASIKGVNFMLWAPHASRVSVVGTFNQWDGRQHPLERHESGVWELFIPDVGVGDLYKYEIRNAEGAVFLKTDPLAFQTEVYPKTAALIGDLPHRHQWSDTSWMARAVATPGWKQPVRIHPVTLGETASSGPERVTAYTQLQDIVLPYLLERGFNQVELSFWAPGETVTGYYAPNPRYGRPDELMAFIDACHQRDIGVILDWIPPLIPREGQELTWFDGTRTYDADVPGQPDMLAFDLGRPEVRNFLAANALFWRQVYHVDALRIDARTFAARLQGQSAATKLRFLLRETALAPTLTATDSTALKQGRHVDPHALLGPHPLAGEPGLSIVRALLPEAESPCLLPTDQPQLLYPLQWVPGDQLFETVVVAEPTALRYQLSVTEQGRARVFADPYAFKFSILGDQDCYLFAEGNHYRIFEKLGAHACTVAGVAGVNFAVWAPNAQRISMVGEFNGWDGRRHPMRLRPGSGIWELFMPGLSEGDLYKFEILPRTGSVFLKTDPFAFYTEVPPGTASVVYDRAGKHQWRDEQWMQQRARSNAWERPVAIYEVHAGSWRRKADGEFLSYRELADQLIPYVLEMGFTHIEFLPLAEHPYGPSWGYQISNFYAPTARFGRPDDLMDLIDRCHQHNIGVILDWVPAHFPKDAHAMAWFDGTCLYEHADPRQGEHPDWGTLIFNYGRHEIENFLIANALYWLETFHFDGLRVDAVASMLYLDYSKKDWIPNKYGGNENLEAIEFIKHTNAVVHGQFPGVMMIAEESTAWPNVSRPTDHGGLGFGFKWNMGWMHDVLFYLQKEPIHRRHHHDKLTFGIVYAFNENFILSLSHDEVVHLKKSLLGKMPGTERQQFANLRLLYAFMYGHPGKKLVFMGGEFGQPSEWNHDSGLEWALLPKPAHQGLQHFVSDLNKLYAREPACHQVDFRGAGFEWLDASGAETGVLAFVRKARDPREAVLFVLNFSDQAHRNYRIGVPYPVAYRELLHSDASEYGGSGATLPGQRVTAEEFFSHGYAFSMVLNLPPLSAVVLKPGPLVLE